VSAPCRAVALLVVPLLFSGCFGTQRKSFDYGPYVASDPRSVVVAPIAGAGPAEQARLLSWITRPLAERGYYVMPVRMTQELAAQEGFTAYERETKTWLDMDTKFSGSTVVENPEDTAAIAEMAVEWAAYFGADAVLFGQIVDWGHRENYSEGYFANMIDAKKDHAVGLDYLLVDDRGQTIWRAEKWIVHTRGGGGVFKEIWNAATKPEDVDIDAGLAFEANWWLITGERLRTPDRWYSYSDPVLVGPYHPDYEADRARR